MEDVWFTFRVINFFLFGGILTGIVRNFRHLHVPDWPGFRYALWAFVAGVAYAAVEVTFLHVPGGPRLVILTLTSVGLFVGCYVNPARRLLARWQEARHA